MIRPQCSQLWLTAGFWMVIGASSQAATRWWDGGTVDLVDAGNGVSAGGAGTWNTMLKNWDQGDGLACVAWDNANQDTAELGGTAGLIDLGAPITVGVLTVKSAHTLDLRDHDLTLAGTGTTIASSAASILKSSGTGMIVLETNQTWSNTSGTMTISAPVDTGSRLLVLDTRQNTLDVTGKISGSGGLTINSTYTSGTTPNNTGGSNPTLGNSNDYTGTTAVNGWIWLNSGGVGAFGTDSSDLVFTNGGVRLTGTGTIDRGISVAGTSGISKASGDTTVNGRISGAGNLQLSANFGSGARVILAAANDFTGDCLNGPDGTVRLAHARALASANLRFADNNGRSAYDLATTNLAHVIGGLKSVGNNSNHLNLGSGTGGGGDGFVSIGGNNQSNTYVGMLSGAAGFKKTGTGIQTLIGANSYTGNTVVAGGSLKLGKIAGQAGVACTLGSGSNIKRITVPSSSGMYIGQAVSGSGVGANARITNINTTTQVSVSVDNTSPGAAATCDFADILGSVASSPVIEVQAGATLDATSFPWVLEATQTLRGNGLVTGAVTLNGTLAPGLSIGMLEFDAADLKGTLRIEYDGGASPAVDAIKVVGALDISAATVDFDKLGADLAGGPHLIATYGSLTGSKFATVIDLPTGYTLDYRYNGENKIALVAGVAAPPYQNWATVTKGLSATDALPAADPDHDGLENAVEFVLGSEPNPANPNSVSSASAPVTTSSDTHVIFTYRRSDLSLTQAGIAIAVEYGLTLNGWTVAQDGVDGVRITETNDGFGAGIDKVEVAIPKTLAGDGRLFAHLKVTL